MMLLSLNIRGVGGTLKTASVRRLLDNAHPDIVFLQETLVDAQRARDFLHYLTTYLGLLCSKFCRHFGGTFSLVGSILFMT
jgi:exonuclease III